MAFYYWILYMKTKLNSINIAKQMRYWIWTNFYSYFINSSYFFFFFEKHKYWGDLTSPPSFYLFLFFLRSKNIFFFHFCVQISNIIDTSIIWLFGGNCRRYGYLSKSLRKHLPSSRFSLVQCLLIFFVVWL